MASLFDTTKQNVSLHIRNCFKEGELAPNSVVKDFLTTAADGKTYKTSHYNLDVIISVGYRVKSRRGVEFRRWATDVLRRYVMDGVAENERRLEQLGQTVRVIERIADDVSARQILDIVKSYTPAFALLDDYDHQRVPRPEGVPCVYRLGYEECREVIDAMGFAGQSELFGREKDDSFKSSIAAIYQGFGGYELYPSAEEKAAHLLYFVVKNHSFSDGNKRIGAAVFLYFLDRCGLLFRGGRKLVSNEVLVAVTIMIAESRPDEMESMIGLVMNFLTM